MYKIDNVQNSTNTIYKIDNVQNSTNTIYKMDSLVCTGMLGANIKIHHKIFKFICAIIIFIMF